MTSPNLEMKASYRSPALRSSKRKANSTLPVEDDSSKRARTRKSTAVNDNTLRDDRETQEEYNASHATTDTSKPAKAGTVVVSSIRKKAKPSKVGEGSGDIKAEKDTRIAGSRVKVEAQGPEHHVEDTSPHKGERTLKEEKGKEEKGTKRRSEGLSVDEPTPKTTKPKRPTKGKKTEEEKDGERTLEGDTPNKVKRKRKTTEEKEAEAMPLAARTAGLRMYIGAHVSSAKGWSQGYSYIVILGLRLYHNYRSTKCNHQLYSYWVICSTNKLLRFSWLIEA